LTPYVNAGVAALASSTLGCPPAASGQFRPCGGWP